MVEINLLPWRQHQQQYQKTILSVYFSTGLVFALVIICVFHVVLTEKNENQLAHIETLHTTDEVPEINESDISRDIFPADFLLKLLDVAAMDDQVCYSALQRERGKITLTGEAQSLASVTHALQTMNESAVLNHLQISEIRKSDKRNGWQFSIDAHEA